MTHEQRLELALESCLDWIDNLQVALGREVVMDSAPNGIISRNLMRELLPPERLSGARCPLCGQGWQEIATYPAHECLRTRRAFRRQQQQKVREMSA